MYCRDVYDEFVGKIAKRCYEYGIGFTVTIKPGYIKTWCLSVFGEHYSKEYAIDVDQLKYTLSRFKDTYTDDILKIVDAVWQKEKAYIQWRVDRMLDGKPFEFEDYEEVVRMKKKELKKKLRDAEEALKLMSFRLFISQRIVCDVCGEKHSGKR